MAIKKQVAAKKTTAIVPWDKKFAQYATAAQEQVKSVGADGVGVKFGRGSIEVGGLAVPEGRLECVVIGSCALNAWYEADYDPNDAQPPDCYAFAVLTDDETMAPHEACTNKQAELCSECDKNQFGTAKTGRGKACGNNIRLGLITAKDAEDADSAKIAELAIAKISPTNRKNWAGYVKALKEEYNRPPWGVVTEISSHDDKKNQIRVEFKFVDLISDEDVIDVLEKRYLKIQDKLQQPYGPKIDRPKPAPRGSQKFAAKPKPAPTAKAGRR